MIEHGRELNSCFMLVRSLFLPHEIQEILSQKEFDEGYDELNYLNNSFDDIKEIGDIRLSIMYLEIKYYLCSKLLRDSDWASMSNSVELRTPFVDWFFFSKLLPLIKSDKSFNKKTVFKSLKDKLPNKLQNRNKTGFSIPHKNYLEILSIPKKFSNPIRDWSLYSYNKYDSYVKKKKLKF